MKTQSTLRTNLERIIFKHECLAGKIFDYSILFLILISSILVILESVKPLQNLYGKQFFIAEIIFLAIFLVEYIFRIYSAENRKQYIFSFYGIIDFLAVVPTIILFIIFPLPYLLMLRLFRIFRIMRLLKIVKFIEQESILIKSIKLSAPKILLFISFVLVVATIFASALYIIEGPENGFTDIPTSIYWAVITLTTVGYGDIVPVTALGRFLATILMIGGYGLIAVPTGIIAVDYNETSKTFSLEKKKSRKC